MPPECGQDSTDISIYFAESTLLEACCFLRWLYQPNCAVPEEFAAAGAAGGLLGAARLAHKLDAGGLLEMIVSHLIEAATTATTTQLIDCLRLGDDYELEALAETCVDRLASQLLAELPWPVEIFGELSACHADTLVGVMRRMADRSAAVLADEKQAAEAALEEQKRKAEAAVAMQKRQAQEAMEQKRRACEALADQKRVAQAVLEQKLAAELKLADLRRA